MYKGEISNLWFWFLFVFTFLYHGLIWHESRVDAGCHLLKLCAKWVLVVTEDTDGYYKVSFLDLKMHEFSYPQIRPTTLKMKDSGFLCTHKSVYDPVWGTQVKMLVLLQWKWSCRQQIQTEFLLVGNLIRGLVSNRKECWRAKWRRILLQLVVKS